MGDARTLRDLAHLPLADVGVKERMRERLAVMGIESTLDLLQHYPRRYHDRTKQADIAELQAGDEATVFAEVRRISSRQTRNRRSLVEAVIHDGTSLLNVTFFNQPWRAKQLAEGTEAAFFGKVELYRGRRQLTNPVVDILGREGENTATVVPVYPQSGKADVFTWQLRDAVRGALDVVGET
jgi:ATP-dependent DNA helicase RecG